MQCCAHATSDATYLKCKAGSHAWGSESQVRKFNAFLLSSTEFSRTLFLKKVRGHSNNTWHFVSLFWPTHPDISLFNDFLKRHLNFELERKCLSMPTCSLKDDIRPLIVLQSEFKKKGKICHVLLNGISDHIIKTSLIGGGWWITSNTVISKI